MGRAEKTFEVLLVWDMDDMLKSESVEVVQFIRCCVAILHIWLPDDEDQFEVFGLLALDFMDDIEVRDEQ